MIGEIEGIKIYVNDETYAKYKKTLEDEIDELQQENKQLKEQLLVAQTNEETFRLEMEDITKILGLDENTLFDDVKAYVRSLKDNWNKLKEDLINDINYWHEQEKEWIKLGFIKFGGEANTKIIFKKVLYKMQELEQGSASDEQGSDSNGI